MTVLSQPPQSSLDTLPRLRLPNGMAVVPQSRVEAEHFYEDLFVKRIYDRFGVTVSAGDCVFDVGGNIGMFTLFAYREAPGVRIFTFEPAPPLFQRLETNLRENGAVARTFNFGIAERERTARFTFYPNSSGMSSFYADAEEERDVLRVMIERQREEGDRELDALAEYTDELLEERFRAVEMECRLRPLSAVIREEGVERIDLLKVDVQKAELDVLRGIDDGDWPRIRQVVMEVHDLDGRLAEIVALLEARGFEVAVEQDEAVRGSILYNLFALRPTAERAPAVFLFPGVGEQYPGMARGLYETEPRFREEVDRAAEYLLPRLGFDLREALFTERERDESAPGGMDLRRLVRGAPASEASTRLSRTEVAQPVAFVVGYALARLWESWGVRPAAVLGHSLGEYTAACVAGVFRLEDALELVALRARAIQSLPGGVMLAVPLPADALTPYLGEGVSLAAANGPELSVLSGAEEAIAAVERRLAEAGQVTRRLAATHAFHSPGMEPVAEEVARAAAEIPLSPPRIPLVSNVTGDFVTDAEATDPSYWARHLTGTVRFDEGAGSLLRRHPGLALVEVGPGSSLSTFVRLHAAASGLPAPVGAASLPHAADPAPEPEFLRGALERLRAAGVLPDPSRGVPAPQHADPVDPATGTGTTPAPANDAAEESETVRALAEIWREVLRVEPRGADDFFELGGHSLTAARLIVSVRERFGVEMRLRTLFQTRTLERMADWIEQNLSPSSP